jgi:hypothetical protein
MSSRKKKKRKTGRKPVPASPKSRFPVVWIILGMLGLVIAAGLILYSLRQTDTDQTTPPASGETKAVASDDFDKLIGRWQRTDGGYIIEIRSIGANGRMDAAYYNPNPINVSQAEASLKEGVPQVFVELQDAGYPGSIYTLSYRPQQDMLYGVYFQATMKQTFEVVFTRAE